MLLLLLLVLFRCWELNVRLQGERLVSVDGVPWEAGVSVVVVAGVLLPCEVAREDEPRVALSDWSTCRGVPRPIRMGGAGGQTARAS